MDTSIVGYLKLICVTQGDYKHKYAFRFAKVMVLLYYENHMRMLL